MKKEEGKDVKGGRCLRGGVGQLGFIVEQGSPNYGPRGHFVRPASRLPVAKNDQSSARCTRGICPNPPKINQYLINTQLHMCTYVNSNMALNATFIDLSSSA